MRRTCVCVSAFRNSLIHEIFSEFLQPFRDFGAKRVSAFFLGVFIFIGFGIFGWLGQQRVHPFFPFNMFTLDTDTGWKSIPLRSSLALVSLSFDSCGWWSGRDWRRRRMINLPCLEDVIDVEEWELEEELAEKPGTTIGMKFSVLHCIRNTVFLWDVVFDHWSIRRNARFHRKVFRAITLLPCSPGLSLSRIYPILWHTQLLLLAFALHHWRLTVVGLHDFVKVSISASLKSFLLIRCIDAPEAMIGSQKAEIKILQRDLQTTQESLDRWEEANLNSSQGVCADEVLLSTSFVSKFTEPAISHPPQAGDDPELFFKETGQCRKQHRKWLQLRERQQWAIRKLLWQHTILLSRQFFTHWEHRSSTVSVPELGSKKKNVEAILIGKWPQATEIRSWNMSYESEVSHSAKYPRSAVLWIGEVGILNVLTILLHLPMDLAYMCVKPQMRLYVCHQMRLLNPQRSSLRQLTFARFARTFFNSPK